MPKDPAMLWYWNDWNGGTITMTRHLKGCYMDLLSAQFNSGPLSLDQIKTVLGTDQASWTVLSKKFKREVNSDGIEVFFNERMVTEKNKRAEFSKKQTERINKRWGKDTVVNTVVLPKIVNENENRNENRNSFFEKSEKLFLKNPELWTEARRDFLADEGWQYKFCSQKGIGKEELTRQMTDFIANLELKEEFKDVQELKSHFTNLFNKQKNSNGSTRTVHANKGKSTGALELLEKVRADYGNNG